MNPTPPITNSTCAAADARWRFHARAAVLLELQSRQRIHPQRCAAEMERLWSRLNGQGTKEHPHAIA